MSLNVISRCLLFAFTFFATYQTLFVTIYRKIVSEYNQEIPQSQTADNPKAPRVGATQPSRDTRETNKAKQPALSSPSR